MNVEQMIAHAEKLSTQYVNGRFQPPGGRRSNCGCSRFVMVEGEYAFKAVHRDCYDDNRAEFDFYSMTTDEVRALLAKPLYISKNGNVIVMEALEPRWRGNAPYNEVQEAIKKAHGFRLSDLHGNNFGERADGTVVCLDYGELCHYVYDNSDASTVDRHYSKTAMAMVL